MPWVLHAAPVAPAVRATVTATLSNSAPSLDGSLNDNCWKSATEVAPFVLNSGKRLPSEPTRAWVCYDDTALYIAFQCKESALDPVKQQSHLVRADARGHDEGRIFRDDTVEVFVQPEPGKPYYHFAMNPANAHFEQRGLDPRWDGGWNGASQIGNGEWTAEFVVLFASLGMPPPPVGTQWRLNLCRQQQPKAEISSWSGLVGGFHQPAQFGTLVFQRHAPLVRDLDLTLLPTGEYAISSLLRSVYPANYNLQLRATANSRAAQTAKQTNVPLTGIAETPVSVRLPLGELPGEVDVQFQLVDAQTGLVFHASSNLPVFQASARGSAKLQGSGPVEFFVNGDAVALPLDARAADFQLRLGVNVLAVHATNAEAVGWVAGKFHFETTDLVTDMRWKASATHVPGWNDPNFDDTGWARAKNVGDSRVWAATPNASELYLRRTIVLSDPEEPAWPHTNEVIFPRNSTQLLFPLIDAPPHLLRGPLTFHLDVPRELSVLDTDALHGAVPSGIAESPSPGGESMKRYTLRFDALPASGFEVSVRYGGLNGDTLKQLSSLRLGGAFGWRQWTDTIIASDRAYSIQPSLFKPAGVGITGTVYFDDFQAHDATTGKVLVAEDFEGAKWKDNPLVVTEMRDGKPTRCLKMEASPPTSSSLRQGDRGRGEGGAIAQLLCEAPVPIQPGTRLVFSCVARGERIVAPGPPARLALAAKLEDAKWKEAPIYTSFELDDGSISQMPRAITVRATSPLAGVMPQKIRLMPCYYNDYFTSSALQEALAENLVRSGINYMYGRGTNRVMQSVATKGVKLVYALEWDPYMTSFDQKYLATRPEARAVGANGASFNQAICPSYLLQADCDFVPKLNDFVAGKVREQKPAEVNWDFEQPTSNPPNFCFCDRCLSKFAESAQLVEKPTREQVLADRMLLAKWADFRCQQNAQTIALVKRAVQLVDVNLPFSIYSGYHQQYAKERWGVDWSLLVWIIDGAICGYNGREELINDTLAALGKVPLIGGQMWLETMSVNEPGRFDHAGWKRRLLRTIVDTGGKGALFWWLPTMSGGGFAQIAELTQFIAQYEDFIVANDRKDNLVQIEPSTFRPRDAKVLMKGEERLVLLFNETREPWKLTVKNLNLAKSAQATVIGEPRPRARADELAVTVPPQGFVAMHIAGKK